MCMCTVVFLYYIRVNPEGVTNFSGWARMALPIGTFSIVEVRTCHLPENVVVDLRMTNAVQ